jgi:hypothetical protein
MSELLLKPRRWFRKAGKEMQTEKGGRQREYINPEIDTQDAMINERREIGYEK